jgi:hypothetical protein
VLHFAEKLIALDHAGAARFMMLEVYEIAIPKLFKPVWYMFGHDVRMYIDLHC